MLYFYLDELIELYQIYHHECKNTHDQTKFHQISQVFQLNSILHFYHIVIFRGQ